MVNLFGQSDACLRNAQAALQQNNYQQAETILSENLKHSSDCFSQFYLAQAIQYQGRTDEALGLLQNILKQDCIEPHIIHFQIALIYFDINQYEKCQLEIGKIKNHNLFHSTLRDCALIFKEISTKHTNMDQAYKVLLNCANSSVDIQARVLLKLENYLPLNLTKRSFKTIYTNNIKMIFAKNYRLNQNTKKLNSYLNLAKTESEKNEYLKALQNLQEAFSLGIQIDQCETLRVQISEKIVLSHQNQTLKSLEPVDIAWAYFYVQRFQNGIEFAKPYLINNSNIETYKNYIELLDITGYMHFCLGQFHEAENLFNKKIELDPKESEVTSYFKAACLQHLHSFYPAINAYKSLIYTHLNAYHTYLNIAFSTLDHQLILHPIN